MRAKQIMARIRPLCSKMCY